MLYEVYSASFSISQGALALGLNWDGASEVGCFAALMRISHHHFILLCIAAFKSSIYAYLHCMHKFCPYTLEKKKMEEYM